MQGLHKGVFSAVLMVWSITSIAGPPVSRDAGGPVGRTPPNNVVIAERSKKSIPVYDTSGRLNSLHEIGSPGASFIKLHFSQFRLPEGVTVEISNPERSEVWRYSANQRDAYTVDTSLRDDGKNRFSAMSISGDSVQLRLLGNLSAFNSSRHAITIDSFMKGLPLGRSREATANRDKYADMGKSDTASVCGERELYDAVCWAGTNNWEYERSAAVAKIINSRGEVCTAWRVGPDNKMFTAEHCLSNQSELDGAEIWFNYESRACGGSSATSAVKVSGGSLISTDTRLDYALFSVNNFSAISGFPSFGLDVDSPSVGEPIFIPQHGLGDPRQIAIESDMNTSGECEVDSLSEDGYAAGSDIGYYCDTTTSSSGSPVVSNISGRVIALHHLGGCMNSGVKISKIWDEVSGHFGGKVPGGGSGGGGGGTANQAPNADYSFNCDQLSCTFDASNSSDSDGSIVEFSWAFGDGNTGSGLLSSHEFSEGGEYAVTLTVKDNNGNSGNQVRTLNVSVPNEKPNARFSSVCVDTQCDFNGANSTDTDGEIVTWRWNFGDGNYSQGQRVSHAYEGAGSYTITLTVEDDKEATDSKIRTLILSAPNEKPVAEFSVSCTELNCNFDAGASSDPDGEINEWKWNLGDGTSDSGPQVSHDFKDEGRFSVTLTVVDNTGATGVRTRNVTVSQPTEPQNQAPEADFSFSCNDTECEFNGTTSHDPDGAVVTWAWSFGEGFSATGERPEHDFRTAGSYSVTLSVEDEHGASDSRTKTISVDEPDTNKSPDAQFTFECDELSCRFDASSSLDPDGSLVRYSWSMGDGGSASGTEFEYGFTESGNFRVALTVEDNEGRTDTSTRTVKVESALPEIVLHGDGSRHNGRKMATLRWFGAESENVELYRDGKLLATTPNDGKQIDTEVGEQSKFASYRLCQPSTQICSSTVQLSFGSGPGQ